MGNPFQDNSWPNRIGMVLAAAFVIWGYLIPANYYFTHQIGVLGDTYIWLIQCLENPGLKIPHHIVYPYLAAEAINFAEGMGFFSWRDANAWEEAYRISVVPVQMFSVFSLLFFAFAIARITKSQITGFLAFLAIGTSYGYWMYGITPNSFGIALAWQLSTMVVALKWYEVRENDLLVVLAAVVAFGVFIHLVMLYFAIGMFLAIAGAIISAEGFDRGQKTRQMAWLILTVVALAVGFTSWQMNYYETLDIKLVFHNLAETDSQGGFIFQLSDFGHLIRTNLNAVQSYISNTVKMWEVAFWREFEPAVGASEPSLQSRLLYQARNLSLWFLVAYVIIHLRRIKPKRLIGLIYFSSSTFIVYIIFFTFRQAGSHYLVFAIVPALILLISLAFSVNQPYLRIGPKWPVIIFSVAGFIYNGFSDSSVLAASTVDYHPYYLDNQYILTRLNEQDSALYLRRVDLNYHPMDGVARFYSSKFSAIEWEWDSAFLENPVAIEDLAVKNLRENKRVFLSPEVMLLLKGFSPKTAQFPAGSIQMPAEVYLAPNAPAIHD